MIIPDTKVNFLITLLPSGSYYLRAVSHETGEVGLGYIFSTQEAAIERARKFMGEI